MLLLSGLALANPLPPPDPVREEPDYRRILGLGAVVTAGADLAPDPRVALTGELWLGETIGLGLGAWMGTFSSPAEPLPYVGIVPVFTWNVRVLSVHRKVALDVVGRHPFPGGGGIGGAVEYRVAGPHLARAAVLAGFDGQPAFELAYTLRWER